MNSRVLLTLTLTLCITGCALFAPYDSKFQCQRSRDYGKCTDVKGAYSEALGGDVEGPDPAPRAMPAQNPHGPRGASAGSGAGSVGDPATQPASRSRYKSAEYAEMARLIEQPVTPIVAPPRQLRTLVVAYGTSSKTLYMPRYVYYFVNDGYFVLGDYLNVEQPVSSDVLYPAGQR